MKNAVPFVISVPALELAAQVGNPQGTSPDQVSPAANFGLGITVLLDILLVQDCLVGPLFAVNFPLPHQLLDVVLLLPKDVL